MGTMAHAITMATNPATSLPAISLFSLDTRFTRAVCPLIPFVRSFVRPYARSSVSSSACTGVCYPTFFATGPLYIASSLSLSLSVSPTLANRSSQNASPFSPLKIARIRNNLVFELTMEELLFLIRKTKSSL